MNRLHLILANIALAGMLAGGYLGRQSQELGPGKTGFLNGLSIPFDDWKPTDAKLKTAELEMLQPDSYLLRRYHAKDGRWAELAVVAGRRKQTVHSPGFCMVGGGWDMVEQRPCKLKLGDRSVPAIRSVIARDHERLMVTYLFTDGQMATDNLIHFGVARTMKRLRAESTLGALIRILVPVTESVNEADSTTQRFAAATLPEVLQTLRAAAR